MRTVIRRAARACTGITYVVLGADVFQTPAPRAKLAGPVLAKLRSVVPIPGDDVALVRLNAATQVAAGAALMAGVKPRAAAAALAASLLPTSAAVHMFWTIEDPQTRAQERIHFFKNTAMLGGLLFAVLDRAADR